MKTLPQVDELMHKLKFAKLMITPVHGPMATECEDSEEGREAQRQNEEIQRIADERE